MLVSPPSSTPKTGARIMTPKFYVGQTVTNVYLGVRAEVTDVHTDSVMPRYDVRYTDIDTVMTAVESVLSDDLSQPFGVVAIEASLAGLAAITEGATSARILGTLTNYQLERISEIMSDTKHNIYQRASIPTDYL